MEIRNGGEEAKAAQERGDAMSELRKYGITIETHTGFLRSSGISLDTVVDVFERIKDNKTKQAEAVAILDEVEKLYTGTGYDKRITDRKKREVLLAQLVAL